MSGVYFAALGTDADGAKSELAVDASKDGRLAPQKVAVRWPKETTIRCDAPRKLAGFLMGRGLLSGCDIDEAESELVVRWSDPAAFYEAFHQHLLASGVAIYEVNAPGSHLESAIEPPPLP